MLYSIRRNLCSKILKENKTKEKEVNSY